MSELFETNKQKPTQTLVRLATDDMGWYSLATSSRWANAALRLRAWRTAAPDRGR